MELLLIVALSWGAVAVWNLARTGHESANAKIRGLVEAEELKVTAQSRPFTLFRQRTDDSQLFKNGSWSEGYHVVGFETTVGDWVDFALPETQPGSYGLYLYLTEAADYGIIRVRVNGKDVGIPRDLHRPAGEIRSTGPIRFGTVDLAAGANTMRLEVIGKNKENASRFAMFGIDGIRIEAVGK